MRKQTAPAPWQELEQQAYHAYREWPLWLVLRERELTERITIKTQRSENRDQKSEIRIQGISAIKSGHNETRHS